MSDNTRDPEPCTRCGRSDGLHDPLGDDCQLPHSHTRRQHPPRRRVGFCCTGCVTRHGEQLTEIVELYATLGQVIDPGSIPDESSGEYSKPRKQPASPAPIRLDAWVLLHDAARLKRGVRSDEVFMSPMQPVDYSAALPDIPSVLAGWAQAVLDDLGLTSTAPDTVSGACALLRGRADAIAGLALVDEYDAELRWVWRALRRAHGLGQTARSVGRCPSLDGNGTECGGSLRADANGDMAVWCARCGRRFNERFLRLLGGMMTA